MIAVSYIPAVNNTVDDSNDETGDVNNLTALDDGGPCGQAVENRSGSVPSCCQLGLL